MKNRDSRKQVNMVHNIHIKNLDPILKKLLINFIETSIKYHAYLLSLAL